VKKYLIILILFSFLAYAKYTALIAPSGLMVEFISKPEEIKILDLKPEFTWIVPVKAKFQTAYQILISSNKNNADNNIGDIWDSGKVTERNSSEVEAGAMLKENNTYFWKVRIWDIKDKPTGFSEIQSFKTGWKKGYSTTKNRFLSTLISPQKIIKTSDDNYFIDFGKDAFGTLYLKINPSGNDSSFVHLGEKLSDKNHIDRNPGGSIRYQKVKLNIIPGKTEYFLNLPPDARNTGTSAIHLPDSFGVVMPFRYCELENCRFEINPGNIFQKAYSYYFDGSEPDMGSM
jgi:alpha-L-rhamnosidase